jgi:tetratricopeptide (TPR) repeat protein
LTFLRSIDSEESTLSGHLTSEQIGKLLAGTLSRKEARPVVAHLFTCCDTCLAALSPEPATEEDFDQPISATFEVVLGRTREIAKAKRWLEDYLLGGRRVAFLDLPLFQRKRLSTWDFCLVLLQASNSLRRDYPAQMIELAEIAVEASRLVPLAPYGLRKVRDLEARAWGELANAYRVADDLARSESALRRAFERFDRGTGDPLLLARLHDLAASLFIARRRFEDASRSLDIAYALFTDSRDRHAAGRVLISAGRLAAHLSDLEAACVRLYKGLKQIERRRDPDLVFLTLHNLLLYTFELGHFAEAWQLLQEMRPLYSMRAKRIDQTRLIWMEGRIAVALEKFEEAELALKQTKEEFQRAGLFYHAAVAGLELAAVWFRQGQTSQVKGIVGELVASFGRVRVQREALAALVMLQQALAQERASLQLIEET